MSRKKAYLDNAYHAKCRESLKKIVSSESFFKKLEKAESPQQVKYVLSRIHPTWVSEVKSQRVPREVYGRCGISRHLQNMSSSRFKKKEFAVKALSDLRSSRWVV